MLVKKKNTVYFNNYVASKLILPKRRVPNFKKKPNSRIGCPTRQRKRKSVLEVFNELGRKMC